MNTTQQARSSHHQQAVHAATHGHAGINPTVHSGAQHTQLLHTGHALKTKLASRIRRDALITLALTYTHNTQQKHTAEHVLLVCGAHRSRNSANPIKIWCWQERAGRCRHQQTVQCFLPLNTVHTACSRHCQPRACCTNTARRKPHTLAGQCAYRCRRRACQHTTSNTKVSIYFFPVHGRGTRDQDASRTHVR